MSIKRVISLQNHSITDTKAAKDRSVGKIRERVVYK